MQRFSYVGEYLKKYVSNFIKAILEKVSLENKQDSNYLSRESKCAPFTGLAAAKSIMA